ncbi:MAG TPA: TRAP transporter small permease subunit [Burkholderiaceae bacterium]|nr:TRAP transporter small permease subunit [Burkholderiaceae bacterium]
MQTPAHGTPPGGLYARLLAGEATLAGICLVAMVVLIFAGGIARLLGHPLNWAIDLATALFAWACFLCADIAWRRDSLIALNWLVERLPPAAQALCRLAVLALVAAFLLYVIGFGIQLAWLSRARSFQGIPGVSYSWVTASMPVGAMLLLATTLRKWRAEWPRLRAQFGGAQEAGQ